MNKRSSKSLLSKIKKKRKFNLLLHLNFNLLNNQILQSKKKRNNLQKYKKQLKVKSQPNKQNKKHLRKNLRKNLKKMILKKQQSLFQRKKKKRNKLNL